MTSGMARVLSGPATMPSSQATSKPIISMAKEKSFMLMELSIKKTGIMGF